MVGSEEEGSLLLLPLKIHDRQRRTDKEASSTHVRRVKETGLSATSESYTIYIYTYIHEYIMCIYNSTGFSSNTKNASELSLSPPSLLKAPSPRSSTM